jgi:chemotaxis protein CheD
MIIEKTGFHYLLPSTIFADREPHVVDTVLGSCISVCLYDAKLKIGGINHYMLPLWNGEGLASPKYGNIAIDKLIDKMLSMHSTKQGMIAKVFGGANQINSFSSVGERNIELAREQLKAYKIRIVAENVGGAIGRKIRFNTETGEVQMKFLSGGQRK